MYSAKSRLFLNSFLQFTLNLALKMIKRYKNMIAYVPTALVSSNIPSYELKHVILGLTESLTNISLTSVSFVFLGSPKSAACTLRLQI